MSDYSYFRAPPPPTPEPPKPKKRSARARYQLTSFGTETLNQYRLKVAQAQGGDGGRDGLVAAQEDWALTNSVEPVDALLLDELEERPQTALELTRSLDTCGIKRPAVEAGLERLFTQTFIEPA